MWSQWWVIWGVLGFLSMVGLAITLSKEALIGVALAAQLTLCCSFLESPTLHAQTAVFLGVCLNQVSLCASTLSTQTAVFLGVLVTFLFIILSYKFYVLPRRFPSYVHIRSYRGEKSSNIIVRWKRRNILLSVVKFFIFYIF